MLTVHRAERADTLADQLARVLSDPPDDPFSADVVVVPARGIERWLAQRLARTLGAVDGDGVAALVRFPSPADLVDEVIDAVAARGTSTGGEDPWARASLVWSVLSAIDASLAEPWAGVLARHLGRSASGIDEIRDGRRYATAAHVTDLFRGYLAQRPGMLDDWNAGRDTDGLGTDLPDEHRWQPRLWRRLRDEVGTDDPSTRLTRACDAIRADPALVDLPARVSVFGPTRFTSDQLAVLAALAAHREVHVWVTHPSPAVWDRLRDVGPAPTRRDDTSARSVANPLTATLARDVREMQQLLRPVTDRDVHHVGPAPAETLLGRVQDDVRADRAPAGGAVADGSIEIHACHGPARQVEVLREVLLRVFDDDPTLEPRDVIVMVPAVEDYAPLFRAAFGQDGAAGRTTLDHPGHRLRVRLADRSLHQTNPVLATVETLLGLADARVTAGQVLDLAATAPVRHAFGFDDDALDRVREWTADAGARWGLGSPQRTAFGLGEFRQNTFATALDRILLGAAADDLDERYLGMAVPLSSVESNDVVLAGRFAEYVDRLDVALRDLRGPHPVSRWSEVLVRALDLLVSTRPADAWQVAHARAEIGAALDGGGDRSLRLSDVRAMLAHRLAGRPGRSNFRTGELTVCTMVPMRSVPHRVVVLLGLDDEVFPRGTGVDGDDLLAVEPVPGQRDPRSEDRQLLSDAVMAASDRLLLFYTGADAVSGLRRPPSVPLREVLDVVGATLSPDDPHGAVESVTTHHPLQPFDPRNFDPAAPRSYDRAALAGARARSAPPRPADAVVPDDLAPPASADIDLDDLIAFLTHPAQGFLRQRLGVRVPELDEELSDSLGVELTGLDQWDVGERMLAARLGGATVDRFRQAEWRRGTVPPATLGVTALRSVETAVETLVGAAERAFDGPERTVDVVVDLGDGTRLTGSVPGVRGTRITRATYSKLAPKHRLTAWIRLLALAAGAPGTSWSAVTLGRGRARRPMAWQSVLEAPTDPLPILVRLVGLRREGLCAPLALPPAVAAEYAAHRRSGRDVETAEGETEDRWSGRYGDNRDRWNSYLYGADSPFTVLTDAPAVPGEGPLDETTRFGALARVVWDPLVAAEREGRP